MAAVQGLYVEIDFKFKNEAFMKGINDVKKILKTLNTDFSNISKTAQGTMKNAGQAVKKGVETNLKQAQKAANDVQKSFEKIGRTRIDKPLDEFNRKAKQSANLTNVLQKGANNIARGAMYKIGAMAVQGMQEGFKGVADVDFNIRGAVAKTGSMAQGYKEMLELANEVGGKTKFNNLDAAIAINSAATLGLMDKEIKELLPSTADLAQAFNSDLNKTLESTIAYIKTYNMETSEAVKVNDMVAMVSKKSAADLDRLQAGFQYVGSTAKSMNIPLESTFAVLGKLNDSGIYGSSAGTALNNFLIQMAKNAPEIEKMIGDKLTDKNGKLKSLPDIFQKVADKVRNLDDTTRSAVLFDLFGIRGGKNILTFLNQGVEGLKELEEQVKNSNGAVNEMARFMMQGIGGAIEELGSTWETAFQSVFQAIEPLMMPIFVGLTSIGDVIIKLNKHFPQLSQAIATIAGLVIGKAVFKLMAKQIGMIKAAFSGAMTLKMLALAAALFIVYQGIKKFKEALDKDKEAAAQWQKIIENAKGVLKELANVIIDVIKAMFGFGEEKNKLVGDGPNKNPSSDLALFLNNIREALRKTQEKLEAFRKWVNEHKEDFKNFGEILKDWAPALLAIALTALSVSAPLGLVIAGIGVAFKFEHDRRKTNKEYEDFKKQGKGNTPFEFMRDRDKRKKDEALAKNPNDWRYKKPDEFIGSAINTWKEKASENWNIVIEGGKKAASGVFNAWKEGASANWNIVTSSFSSAWGNIQLGFGAFVQWFKEKILELADFLTKLTGGMIPFHGALGKAKELLQDIMSFAGKVITITLNFIQKGTIKGIVNDVVGDSVKGLKSAGAVVTGVKQEYTGTNHFSGGITAINEKGDELIMGPSGMVVANNPSTMNIMNKLSNLESQTSQMRFRMGESQGSVNNITLNIGSVRSNDDIDEIKRTLENLYLS